MLFGMSNNFFRLGDFFITAYNFCNHIYRYSSRQIRRAYIACIPAARGLRSESTLLALPLERAQYIPGQQFTGLQQPNKLEA